MIDLNEIKLYLPKYLSENSAQDLFENLKDFPQNLESRMYSARHLEDDVIFQGDGIEGFLVVNLPDTTIQASKVVILSNTCDLDLNNIRLHFSSICYCPIFDLNKYLQKLVARQVAPPERIRQFAESVKKQKISQIFFLPKGGKLLSDSFIFFDKINSCNNDATLRQDLTQKRLFTLSNYGFYLFLFKLSIHFSRVREAVDRG